MTTNSPPLMNALEILKAIVTEIETSRASDEARKSYERGLLIRLALHQLDHGPMRYANDDPRWDRLLKLAEAGELGFSFGGGTTKLTHECPRR